MNCSNHWNEGGSWDHGASTHPAGGPPSTNQPPFQSQAAVGMSEPADSRSEEAKQCRTLLCGLVGESLAERQHWRRLGRCDSRMGLTQKTLCSVAELPGHSVSRRTGMVGSRIYPMLKRWRERSPSVRMTSIHSCQPGSRPAWRHRQPHGRNTFALPLVKCHNLENLSNNLRAPVS